MIEQLEREKLELATELSKLYDQATKATEMRHLVEEEAARSRLIVQAAEVDKQMLQQELQNLTDMVEHFRNTTANSVNEVLNRLKLDLNLYTGGSHEGWKVPLDVTRCLSDKMRGFISRSQPCQGRNLRRRSLETFLFFFRIK